MLTVLMTPLMFLSGMMFPIGAMPGWIATFALANPLTYAVDAMRRTIVARLSAGPPSTQSQSLARTLSEPVALGGWHPPLIVELAAVVAFAAATLVVASHRFSRLG